jgi:outer membrane receptor protein involved in Fe transport
MFMRVNRSSLFLCSVLALVSAEARAEKPASIAIPPGPLGDAIILLGRQAGTSIGLRDQSLASISVRGVSGRLTTEQALRRLLDGKGAKAKRVSGNGWIIVAHKREAASTGSVVKKDRAPQPPAPPPVDVPPADIIVTASKQGTAFKDMPASVTIVGGQTFQAQPDGANGSALASRVVGITSTHFGPGRNKLFVRGIADSGFSGPTQATVGQYLGDARINYSAPDPDIRMHDVQSVEIIEGPQSTLYGAGSLGGIIRVTPSSVNLGDWEGRIIGSGTLTKGGAPGGEFVGVANVPIVTDKVAIRGHAFFAREGGYIDDEASKRNNVNTIDTAGGRATLSVRLSPDWQIDAMGVIQTIESHDAQYAERGVPGLARKSRFAQPFDQTYKLANLRMRGDIAGLKLTVSADAVRNKSTELFEYIQFTGDSSYYVQRIRSSILSGEARLAYEDEGSFSAVAGTSFVESKIRTNRALDFEKGSTYVASVGNDIREISGFSEATLKLAKGLRATVGGRVSFVRIAGAREDDIIHAPQVSDAIRRTRKDTLAAPSAALLYHISPSVTAYARYQQGYRPGGLALDNRFLLAFENDRIRTAELGVRFGQQAASPFRGQISLSTSRWTDIQADVADEIGLPITDNIGNGTIRSAGIDLSYAPSDRFGIDAAFLWNKSRLTSATADLISIVRDASLADGRSSLPNVADLNGRLALRASGPLFADWSWDLNAAIRYTGKSRLGLGKRFDHVQGGYFQSNLVVRVTRDNVSLFTSLTNLTNDKSSRFAIGNPLSPDTTNQYVPQRPVSVTIGADISF